MPTGDAAAHGPVTSASEAIARMKAIEASAPPGDGLGCFNRMYIEITDQVDDCLSAGFFADPAFMTQLDITFANLYFEAVDAAAGVSAVPLAWRPLIERRSQPGIEPVQFALAGMNAHINHDLPLALAATCTAMATSPSAGSHQADYEKVDRLLDAAERSIRQSLESSPELAVDRHLQAVCDLVASWSINSARDLAWNNSLLLWEVRDDPAVRDLVCDGLAAATAVASRLLLIAV